MDTFIRPGRTSPAQGSPAFIALLSGEEQISVTSFRCPYCNKSYARESWWRKHDCEKKKRFELVHNMDFRRAWKLFTHWRERNGYVRRGKEVTVEEFIESWMYNSFMTLVKFTSDNWVITSLRYLDFLIDYRIAVAKWSTEDTLKVYRDHIRRTDDPIAQIATTYAAIQAWCKKNEVPDPRDFFGKIGPGTALQMISSNQISPWVLFGYDRSRNDLLVRMNDDWFAAVNEYINNKHWITRIQDSDDIHRSIQSECERLFLDE